MKIFAFAFAIVLAGVSAVPSLNQVASDLEATKANERFIEGIIANAIADAAQSIRDAGLDPYNLEGVAAEYKLPVTDLLSADAVVENVVSTGLSDIVIERNDYSLLTNRLRLTIALPKIFGSVDNVQANAQVLGWDLSADGSGSLAIIEPRVAVDVRIQLGIISGISIRSLSVDFSVGGIESNLNLNILGHDLSGAINTFAGEILTNALADNRDDINQLLEHIIQQIIENAL